MENENVEVVAKVTYYGDGNVSVKPVGTNGKELLLKELSSDGTMFVKRSGESNFVKAKKGKTRHRERDKVIKRTVTATLSVSPSGSRVKVGIALDREEATEESFTESLTEILDSLSDVLYEYLASA